MNTAISGIFGNQPIFEPLPLIPTQKNVCAPSTIDKIKRIIRYIKEKIWAFVKETSRLIISALHVVSNCEISDSVTGFPSTMANTAISIHRKIAALGLISFVKAVINTLHVLFKVEETVDKSKINDIEGSAIAALDVTGSSLETVYDVAVGLAALASLGAISFDISFCLVAIPCAIIPLIYQICKLAYFIVRHEQFIRSIPKDTEEDASDKLTHYLDDKLGSQIGVDEEGEPKIQFNAKKLSILERRSDERVVKLMKKMKMHLNSEEIDSVKVEAAKSHIKKIMYRKIVVESVGACVDTAMLVSIIAGMFISRMPSHMVHVVAGIKSVQSFVRTGIYYLLRRWDKNNAPKFILE